MVRGDEASIIALDRFIQATRDSGYKGTASAISELVDNSLQAGATKVWIEIGDTDDAIFPLVVDVLDNGSGMDRPTLRQALRFGGSSRFDDRSGLGRFGMGLPNASLSQAKRVDVFTWVKREQVNFSYLDVDEIAEGKMALVPEPRLRPLPELASAEVPSTGTLVRWTKCDRLSHVRASTIIKKLHRSLGQIFRHFIWDGTRISINGEAIDPLDPLLLRRPKGKESSKLFAEPLPYEVAIPTTKKGEKVRSGKVTVTFAELPVAKWHSLSNDEKRKLGISNGAGVSIIRGGREIDYGWFFMGNKRRENYDDWWRCEISFDPVLDEAFGITHTKQQIRPQEYLIDILVPDLEQMAKALNGRVRQSHTKLKVAQVARPAEQTATSKERLLEPLPRNRGKQDVAIVRALERHEPSLKENAVVTKEAPVDYRIVEANVNESTFFSVVHANNHFVLAVNPEHPFYRHFYRSLSEKDSPDAKESRTQLDLLLLAAARAEASATSAAERRVLADFRGRWSDVLATFLNR